MRRRKTGAMPWGTAVGTGSQRADCVSLGSFAGCWACDGLREGFGAGAHLIGLVGMDSPWLRAGEWTAGAEWTQGDSQAAPTPLWPEGKGAQAMVVAFLTSLPSLSRDPVVDLPGLQMDSLVISSLLLF